MPVTRGTRDLTGLVFAIATWDPSLADRAHHVRRRFAELLLGPLHKSAGE